MPQLQAEIEVFGNRPETDYRTELTACPECGLIRPPEQARTCWSGPMCGRCLIAGHIFRRMGVAELRWTANREKLLGYHEKAAQIHSIADTLARVVAAS